MNTRTNRAVPGAGPSGSQPDDPRAGSELDALAALAQGDVDPRQPQPVHLTREQDVASPVHGADYGEPWKPPTNLDAPPPRPGYVQRWIRTNIRDKDDPGNISQMLRAGWRPRTLESAGLGSFPVLPSGQYKGFIGLHDCVLCEMPKERAAQIKRYYKAMSDRMVAGVETELASQTKTFDPRGVFKLIQERQSEVSGGARRPIVAGERK